MASYPERACPNCASRFNPRRIDQNFCSPTCKSDLYAREYRSLFYQFPKALIRQAFTCGICGRDSDDGGLRPVFLDAASSDDVMAVCQFPCKQDYYKTLA